MQPGVLPWTKQTAAISIPFQGDCRPQLTLRPEILSIFISCGHTGHVHLWDFRRTSRNVPLCALCLFQWLPNEHPRKWFVSSRGQIAYVCDHCPCQGCWHSLVTSHFRLLTLPVLICRMDFAEIFLIDNMMPVHSEILLTCVQGQEMKAYVLNQDFLFLLLFS